MIVKKAGEGGRGYKNFGFRISDCGFEKAKNLEQREIIAKLGTRP
jgi:hypothetical protein